MLKRLIGTRVHLGKPVEQRVLDQVLLRVHVIGEVAVERGFFG